MRFSKVAVLALIPAAAIAAPIPHHEEPRQLGEFFDKVRGVASTIVDSFRNPQLLVARLQVVRGLRQTGDALGAVGEAADASGNAGVTALLADAAAGLDGARTGVNNIGQALLNAEKPQAADQKIVAEGIKAAQDAVALMPAAITTPDAGLDGAIADAVDAVAGLAEGGKGVLEASGLDFADLGLPDNFDQLPPAAAPPPPAADEEEAAAPPPAADEEEAAAPPAADEEEAAAPPAADEEEAAADAPPANNNNGGRLELARINRNNKRSYRSRM